MKVVQDDALFHITTQMTDRHLGGSVVLNGSLEAFDVQRTTAAGTSLGAAGTGSGTKRVSQGTAGGVDGRDHRGGIEKSASASMDAAEASGGLSPTVPTFDQFALPPPSSSTASNEDAEDADGVTTTVFNMNTATTITNNNNNVSDAFVDREAISRARAFSLTSTHTGLDEGGAQLNRVRSRSGTMDSTGQRSRSGSLVLAGGGRSSRSGSMASGDGERVRHDLVAILNESWPDYDFGSTSPSSFVKHDDKKAKANVVQKINGYLASLGEDNPGFLKSVWDTINDTIVFSMQGQADDNANGAGGGGGNNKSSSGAPCDLYSYEPDGDDDEGGPFSEGGVTWSFNYFFHNRGSGKILYFTCTAKSGGNNANGDNSEYECRDEGNGSDDEEEVEESERSYYCSEDDESFV